MQLGGLCFVFLSFFRRASKNSRARIVFAATLTDLIVSFVIWHRRHEFSGFFLGISRNKRRAGRTPNLRFCLHQLEWIRSPYSLQRKRLVPIFRIYHLNL